MLTAVVTLYSLFQTTLLKPCFFLRFEVLTVVLKILVFRDVMPCELVNSYWLFKGLLCLHHQGLLDCLTLKMKALQYFELWVTFPTEMALYPRRLETLCCFCTVENCLSCIGVLIDTDHEKYCGSYKQ